MGANNLYFPSTERTFKLTKDNFVVIDDKRTGLPLKITIEEFFVLVKKLGLISASGASIVHLPNVGTFPVTGDLLTLYIDDSTDIMYTWNGTNYVAIGPVANNIYTADGVLSGDRLLDGDGNALTFENISTFLATANTVGITADKGHLTLKAQAADYFIKLETAASGAVILPKSSNPSAQVISPLQAALKYNTTSNVIQYYDNTDWRTIGERTMVTLHAPLSTVLPVTPGVPTTGEIATFASNQSPAFKVGMIYYNNTDSPGVTPTHVYWVDVLGNVVLVKEPSAGGGGGGGATYADSINFTANVTETINHNLGTEDVIIMMLDENGSVIIPNSIKNFTPNTVDITVLTTDIFKVIIK